MNLALSQSCKILLDRFCDIEQFPAVPFWIIEKDQVLAWWNASQLGTTTKISRDQILLLLEGR